MTQLSIPESHHKVWFITGASSGFGRRLVLSALARGDFVIATLRSLRKVPGDLPRSNRLHLMELDVTEGPHELKLKLEDAARVWGRIDVCVNSAGVMLPALVEEAGSSQLREQFRINVFGMMDIVTAVLPHMRAQRSGTLVLIGSRSSWRPEVEGTSLYCQSKAAIRCLGETLAVELVPFGVKVLIVEPGAFRTEGMLTAPFYKANPIPDYDRMRKETEEDMKAVPGNQPGDPAKAMEVLVDVVRGEGVAKGRPMPLYLPLGTDAEAAIRGKCATMTAVLDEWQDVIRSTDITEDCE
ncbi:hypothetical protein HWV62_36476 [Athelia sp. TMB]|nr:hypothetical protein HWV62_36476 [Athelia sp. TMB]